MDTFVLDLLTLRYKVEFYKRMPIHFRLTIMKRITK